MIGFIGLSHLGLNYSLATAAKGLDVVCYDSDKALVERLKEGLFPIEEPGFKELFAAHRSRIHYTSVLAELEKCDLVFYALDVGTNERNESDISRLNALIEMTAPVLSSDTIAVVMSQVRPGFMRSLLSRMRLSPQLWYYQVETLIFGAAVQRALEPERYIVGAADAALPLPESYRRWLGTFGCPVLVMRYESAELAKIAINLYLVSTVSTTNTLAEICEAIGADWSEIAPALRLDKRIGLHAYLKPGLGIAGGNLERDLVTVREIARENETEAGIIDAWQQNSAHAKSWAIRVLRRLLLASTPTAKIAVWGLTYKQDTHSIKNSASIELIRELSQCEIHAYDPVAKMGQILRPNLKIHSHALDALSGAEALAIMTPWAEFGGISPGTISERLKGSLVVDPYGLLDGKTCAMAGLRHFRLGRG
jgi:UDPglucose 6-dehydrogenase